MKDLGPIEDKTSASAEATPAPEAPKKRPLDRSLDPMRPLGALVKNVMGFPLEMAGQLDVASGLKTPEQAKANVAPYSQSIAETIPYALVGGPLGTAARVGAQAAGLPKMVQAVAPAVGRALGSAGVAGMQAPEGERLTSAGLSAAGSLAMEPVAPFLTRIFQSATPVVRAKEAARIGKQAGRVLPEVASKEEKELFKVVRGGTGEAARKAGLDRMINQVEKMTAQTLEPGAFRAALDRLEQMADKAFPPSIKNLSHADRTATKEARRLYAGARRNIVTALNGKAPGAGDIFDAGYKRASALSAYLQLLDKSFDPSGKLDTGKLMALVNKTPQNLRQQFGPYWRYFRDVLTRGQGTPAKVDKPFHAASPRTYLHGLATPRYKAGPGFHTPMEVPPEALTAAGGAYPGGALTGVYMGGEGLANLVRRHSGMGLDDREE